MTGRPRDPDMEKRLLAAAWKLMTAGGYEDLSFAKVAAEAAAHRTDVYRRWNTKAQLVADTLAEHLPRVAQVDTGSLYGDLRSFVGNLSDAWSPRWMDSFVFLLAELHHDSIATATFQRMAHRRRQPLILSISRAEERREIDEGSDPALIADLLEGPLMHRRLFFHTILSPHELDCVAHSAYRALTRTLVEK